MRRELNQICVPRDFDENLSPPRCLGLHDRTGAATCAYSPVITHRATSGGKLELDLGTAGTQTDIDLRPDYTLNWLPAPGQSAVIKVRLRYLYKGEEYGNWSEWHTWDPHRGLDARRHIDRNAKTVHSQTQKDFRHRKHHETPAHFLPPPLGFPRSVVDPCCCCCRSCWEASTPKEEPTPSQRRKAPSIRES